MPKGSLGGDPGDPGDGGRGPAGGDAPKWQMTPHTDPSWDIKGCYITQIKGDAPCVYNKHMIFPKPGVGPVQPGAISPPSA